jgi:C-terminal processing protease CtpA/Prc
MIRKLTLWLAVSALLLSVLLRSMAEEPSSQPLSDNPAFGLSRPDELVTVDHEFDQGSGVQISNLTPVQIQNLAMLGRVWGFLKYHHPVITAGKRNWDYELLRIMPEVLRARSRAELIALLGEWIDKLGSVEECATCNLLDPEGLKLKPDLDWINDTNSLSASLSQRLLTVYRSRVPQQQYYVALIPRVGNPVFPRELAYSSVKLPDSGYQLLGLFRFWNIIEYWYPYRDGMGEDWPNVLKEFIPTVALAGDRDTYARVMMEALTRIHDSHANVNVPAGVRPPYGECRLPVNVRMVDGTAIVSGYSNDAAGKASGLKYGDEITAIDGVPVNKLLAEWAPLYAASNDTVRLRTMTHLLTNGECGSMQVDVRRDNSMLLLSAIRLKPSESGSPSWTHDVPGPTFRMLSRDIAYLKLSSIRTEDVLIDILRALDSRGLIVDLRNYPSDFDVFTLGSRLVQKSTQFASFACGDLSNPGAFRIVSTSSSPVLTPAEPHYTGKVVILVDEETMSQAEYTAMALRASPNAIVVGSMTAGADGNVSAIPLPGGLSSMMSGIGIFYPDGSPTQRVGIHVDVEMHPTVAGIRAGRDEVLERAIREIDPELSDADVEKLARAE